MNKLPKGECLRRDKQMGQNPAFVTVGTTGLKAPTKGVNGEVNNELLETKLIPACKEMMAKINGRQATRKNWIFQQDNARAHISQVEKNG